MSVIQQFYISLCILVNLHFSILVLPHVTAFLEYFGSNRFVFTNQWTVNHTRV